MTKRAKAGLIREVARDSIGNPIKDRATANQPDRFRYNGTFVFDENDEATVNRLNASMRIGKGTGLVTMRLLEIFAFSRTPGYNTRPGGLTFSSSPYEGIARYLNPMEALIGKFKMGDQIHNVFFC